MSEIVNNHDDKFSSQMLLVSAVETNEKYRGWLEERRADLMISTAPER